MFLHLLCLDYNFTAMSLYLENQNALFQLLMSLYPENQNALFNQCIVLVTVVLLCSHCPCVTIRRKYH